MKLSNLIETARPLIEETPICHPALSVAHDPDIRSIHYRAQEVTPGGLFAAVPGLAADGHNFIDHALARGAAAILTQKTITQGATAVTVSNTRKALGGLSSAFFGRPSERLCIIGITGTNGKTTTAYLVESILAAAGHKVGLVGTIDYHYDGRICPNPVTTPESLDIQRILSEMLICGVTHVVMEISSHAIDLLRICACYLDVGVFTNLSQDHLDYHGDMDAYWQCKKRLFTTFLNQGPKKNRARAVINIDNEKGRDLLETLDMQCIGAGSREGAVIRPADISHALEGVGGKIHTPAGTLTFSSPLVGRHNLENILCAVGVGIALEMDLDSIREGVENLPYVPGRLEPVARGNWNRFVYVDYAHTPDALENVILAIRAVTSCRIICIFGCGGDRDRTKRPQMGEIAGRLCDLSVITSDNPRTENPLDIIDEIIEGIRKTASGVYRPIDLQNRFVKKGYIVEADRSRAIDIGIRASRSGDVVLIAGKGHENYQVIGKRTIEFDDKRMAEKTIGKFRSLQ
ncbi:MAG: UDP-N-acetylmuramoyl-L-alanyl-D-glutamate--2,6-diaminopimelate ligase [Deltaproteobacteria bacterium]|nr:UDP-N-acetylmuramoyl-L-alanyl-D-glutamate--2,6-diaminopimelate ligase [Deltaproteobacteria bacterium]